MAPKNKQPETIKTSHSSSTSSEYFPMDIVIEILSRLPVESLLRCKSVSKSWRSLISDPRFISYHLTLSTTNHLYAHHRLLVSSGELKGPKPNLKVYPLYDVLYDHISINPLKLYYPMKHPHKEVSIVGSCNGLICIAVAQCNLFIWNPSTRKSIKLPDYPRSVGTEFPRSIGTVFHGFGNKESSDDYKVVEITWVAEKRPGMFAVFNNKWRKKVMIYSSKNGNWKEIGDVPHFINSCYSSVYLNGALHWLAWKDSHLWTIVSLDLAKETYGEVLLPVGAGLDMSLRLGIIGDCLCVLYQYDKYKKNCSFLAEVWVMKVYDDKDSWSKLISIPSYLKPAFKVSGWINMFSAPLCVSDDGKVLLFVFDSKDDSTLEIRKFYECNEACSYVESLVSPPHRRD